MAQVSLKNIKKIYDRDVVAVQEFNLDIADNEFIVLVGPSGCGKSTTLRMVAGLEEISSGELSIDGRVVNDTPAKERDIAMVFQNYALYPHMTVYNNMAFALQLKKVDKKEIDRKVREAAEILGITNLLARKPRALSGGQRQRVAIGRAIVREPKVFLMDEPLSNLDAKLRNQMRAEIIKLRSRINTTFIYVTHDQTEAMTLGDRIVIMKDGFIQQIGTPKEVFDRPANYFVAGFIGSPQMNFFDGKLKLEGGRYSVTMFGETVVPGDAKQEILKKNNTKAGDVIVGIRPEHITLSDEKSPWKVTGNVDVFEMMGSTVHVHLNVDGKDAVVILQRMDVSDDSEIFKPGGKINFTFKPNMLHLFDKETEKSLFI